MTTVMSGRWFHASPYDLIPGTTLVPDGAPSPFRDVDYAPYLLDREGYVWVSPTLKDAHEWRSVMSEDVGVVAHIYEVTCGTDPEDRGEDDGWVTDSATVVRKVFDGWNGEC